MADDPWRFETARLSIRRGRVDDAEAIHTIRAQMPFDPPTRDLTQTRAMLAAMAELPPDAPGWRNFVLLAAAGGPVLGDIGVQFDHPGPRQAMLGFALAPEARGQGFATEAVGAIVERLFAHGLHRIEALTDARNLPTQRLLHRLRFRQEGHFVQSWQDGDGWSDEYAYARLASE